MGLLDFAKDFAGGAEREAGKTADRATKDATATNLAAYAQSRADTAPYRQVGGYFLDAYAKAMGLNAYNPADQRYNQIDPMFAAVQAKYLPRLAPQNINPLELIPTGQMDGKRELYADPKTGFAYRLKKGGKKAVSAKQYLPEFGPQQTFLGGSETNPAAPTGDPADRYGGFYESPAYRFNLDEALQSVERSAGASGYLPTGPGALSGRFSKEMARYASGLASNEFGDYLNRLAAGAGIGQTTSTNNAYGALNTGNMISRNQVEGGAARASGIIGQAGAQRGLVSDAISTAAYTGWI